jgi:hypothetical protein
MCSISAFVCRINLKLIKILLRCHLPVLIVAEVIPGLNDHIHHDSLVQLIQLRQRQSHLLRPQEEHRRVYFPLRWAASFFGFELVLRDPR